MTTLEVFLIIILWFILGIFISFKRNWYKKRPTEKADCIVTNILLAPLVCLFLLFIMFFIADWNNE